MIRVNTISILMLNRETRKHFSLRVKLTNSRKEDLMSAIRQLENWSSEEEHRADALALGADEGRDKLRKAAVRRKYPLTRRSPNEGTHLR